MFQFLIDAGIVGEINVGPTIAVVVDKHNAAAHGFDDELLLGDVGVAKANASLLSDVFELRYLATGAGEAFCARWHDGRRMAFLG